MCFESLTDVSKTHSYQGILSRLLKLTLKTIDKTFTKTPHPGINVQSFAEHYNSISNVTSRCLFNTLPTHLGEVRTILTHTV